MAASPAMMVAAAAAAEQRARSGVPIMTASMASLWCFHAALRETGPHRVRPLRRRA